MPIGVYKRTEWHKDRIKNKFQKGHQINLGRKHSDEFKRKVSQGNKEKHNNSDQNNPFYGRRHTEETKQRMSNIKKTFFAKGSKPWNYKGGILRSNGRIFILKPEHPFVNCGGYVMRSHLVMEQMIGRYLKPEEVVHHINSNTLDDRPENLKLFASDSEHQKLPRHSIF